MDILFNDGDPTNRKALRSARGDLAGGAGESNGPEALRLLREGRYFARKSPEPESGAEVLVALGQKLNAVATIDEAARVIVEAADGLFGWDSCTFSLYSSDSDTTQAVLEVDTIGGQRVEVTTERTPHRPTIRGRKTIREGAQLILRPTAVFDKESIPFGDSARPSASILAVPIRHGPQVLGIVSIQSYQSNAYTRETMVLLQALADYCGGAINRIRAEVQLRESEERFRLLAETINDVFWIQDPRSGSILYISPAYERIWARKAVNLDGSPRPWADTIHPEDLARVVVAEASFARDQPRGHEYRIIRPDGEIRWIHDRAFPVRDGRGRLHRLVGLAEDVTERHTAQERIGFQASLLGQVRNAVIATDLAGKVTYWNKQAETLYQWPCQEAVGRNLRDLIVPPELQAAAAEVISQVAGRGFWEGEFNVHRKDGSTFAAHIVDAVLRDSELRHIGYVCVSMDITERKRVEQTLRQSEGRFSAFIENLPGFAWIKDLSGRYVFLSPDRGQRQDHPPDWQGKTTDELWPRELSEEYKKNDEKVMATGEPVQTIESYYRGGQRAYALVSKFPILDAKGKVSMIGGIAVDVTDRKEAEERVRRSEEQLHELAMRLQGAREEESLRIAREIHDVLGQALTSLNMDLTSLRDETDKEGNLQLRASLRRRIKAMQTLLKGTVKSVQRISSDLRPGLLDDLGLSAALEWQAQEFERRTKIRCHWKRKPPSVELNPTQSTALFRIFQEALTNVARHARARRVNLELEHQEGFLVLEISDDGKGFKENKVFTQDSLGLLGMRERANLIGAGLQIRSAPKKGTVVTVALATEGSPNNSKVHDRSKPHKNSHRR